MHLRLALLSFLFVLVLAACGSTAPAPTATAPAVSSTPTTPPSVTDTPSSTPTPIPTGTPTPTITHTYAILRGVVVPEKLSCRFGPGAVYLYKFGILQDSNIELLGRMAQSQWMLVRAIGSSNACWVKSDLVEIDGSIDALAPTDPHVVLAWSPYYGALTGAQAVREDDEVTVTWHPLVLNAGDDSEQIPYVLETWLCVAGEIAFEAVGVYYPQVTVTDEAGCAEASRARVAGAEKHGYTPWSDVAWPPHPDSP